MIPRKTHGGFQLNLQLVSYKKHENNEKQTNAGTTQWAKSPKKTV